MNNLIASLACVVCIVSLWMIAFFIWRIIVRKLVMYSTFNMPTPEELREMYERNNAIIEHREIE